jgi:hypothetical protein
LIVAHSNAKYQTNIQDIEETKINVDDNIYANTMQWAVRNYFYVFNAMTKSS